LIPDKKEEYVMLTKRQALDEAQRQKEALAEIGIWRRNLFIMTSVFLVFAIFGVQGSGTVFVLGVCAAVLTAVSLILTFIVNLSIRNGRRNVERILESIGSQT